MSTLKLYKSTRTDRWQLLANKLFKIDNISQYLNTIRVENVTTIENFQYIKTQLEVSIKVDMSQTNAEAQSVSSYKYVSIQNDVNGTIAYYFVKKPNWRSKNCVMFDLILDVLNTYTDGTDFTFKPNTRIIREHKDRFVLGSKNIKLFIDMLNPNVYGSIDVNDEVTLINDHGDSILEGKVITISATTIYIDINNPTSEEDYMEYITPFIEDPFEINKNGANYIRFMVSDDRDFAFETTYHHYRKIDYIQENINPLLRRDASLATIEKTGPLNQNWYLLYRNQNDPSESLVNPVDCYLIPENETKTDAGVITGGRLIPSWLEDEEWYVFKLASGQTITFSNGESITYSPYWQLYVVFQKSGDTMSVSILRTLDSGGDMFVMGLYDSISYATFAVVPANYKVFNTFYNIKPDDLRGATYDQTFTNTDDYNVIDPISLLDRTDAKNIKLIKLPYCPFNFSYWGSTLEIDDNEYWERASFAQVGGGDFYALHLIPNKSSSVKLENTISASGNNPFTQLKINITPNIDDLRNTSVLDSKLFHSEFYAPTYIYDSFNVKVELEKCNLSYYISNGVSTNNIKFLMTKTINSKFMFTLASYICDKPIVNFYNLITIARNNEEVLYNVPYVNYVRNGMNYDIKNKNLQNVSNWLGVGLGAVSIGASLMAPTVPLKVAGVVGSLVSMALSVKGAITASIQNEQSLQQKILQTQNQTASVSGSDDVDLMSEYCDNRLKYVVYHPTENMEGLLNELFFYAGYNSSRMGVPTHNNRVNFDYLECDAVLEAISANMSQEILTELVNSYKTGVTYIHKTTRNTDKWDIEQKYENWEVSLLEE